MLLRNDAAAGDPDIFLNMATPSPVPYHNPDDDNETQTNNSIDDVWGDSDDDSNSTPSQQPTQEITNTTTTTNNSTHHSHPHPSDVPRLQQEHTKAGYRDGVTCAKASSVQAGFDEGFGLGATIGAKAGQILGLLTSLVTSSPPGEEKKRLQDLLNAATAELSVRSIFSPEYWADDGTWKYHIDVPSPTESGVVLKKEEDPKAADLTFSHVAAAHPLLKRWTTIIHTETDRYGLVFHGLLPEEEEETDEKHGKGVKKLVVTAAAAAAKEPKGALAW
ncbi:hypothetical protein B0H66DRAFT_542660 [Apodospora peruviana]|uniref:Protein YAE1 n=1 Tax=Apodospora peruviana TaxID=516989 RepID=A0AAE0IRP1_9PEZI|nr:hypothetical protein B0H66DRAFT_542660 [Apodospora peruviana]